MIEGLRFDPIELPEGTGELRAEVRAFMEEERTSGTLVGRTPEDGSHCPEFSKRLGERGWIAMMWPKKYGGHERSALERYVVGEELIVAAAPTTAHFVADRQSGPLLLRFGSEEQRQTLLPRMARGQFIIDLSLPNIEIRPIYNLAGNHHFNEVVFNDCPVANDMIVGEEGNGWNQVMGELGYERSGPERFLSGFRLYTEIVRAVGPDPTDTQAEIIGRIAAHLMTLRSMSISVAGMLQAGLSPKVESSLVKDLGTNFDREIPEIARLMFATELSTDASGCFEKALADAMLIAPTWTIQGGSKEILRTVISKGIGL